MNAELPEELAARRDEILRHATGRGMRLRIRRRAVMAAVVVIALSATVGAVAALAGGDHQPRVATSPEPDSTLETTSTTISDSTTTDAPTADSTSADSSPATDAPPTTGVTDTTSVPVATDPGASDTTALVCHNSYDPGCGPWSLTSTPVNRPLELTVDHSVTGPTVKLHVHASDDAAVDACMRVTWGDGEFSSGPSRFGCTAAGLCPTFPQRYGPWDPPPPTLNAISIDFAHTYKTAATLTITVDADSAAACSPDQYYASVATSKLVVTVTGATATTAA